MASLSEESHLAGLVKKEEPILVILGNPPYSGHSTNVYEEVRAYYQIEISFLSTASASSPRGIP